LGGVVAELVLPNDLKDSNFPDEILAEIGNSGIYKGSFTPDQEGEWKAICHKADGDGQVVKRFSVGLHNVHSVGQAVGGLNAGIDILDDKADTTHSKLDDINTKVSSLDTPPMVS